MLMLCCVAEINECFVVLTTVSRFRSFFFFSLLVVFVVGTLLLYCFVFTSHVSFFLSLSCWFCCWYSVAVISDPVIFVLPRFGVSL